MKQYHKIQTIYKRDRETGALLEEYSLPVFEYLKDNRWVFTEKVDGTNIRVMLQDGKLLFGGKTDRAELPELLLSNLHELFREDELAERFPDGVCLYGEGYGEKIQTGGKYRKGQGFVLFDVKVGRWWLEGEDVMVVADQLGVSVVPIVGQGSLHDMTEMCKVGFKSTWGDFQAEGIVARPEVELQERSGTRIITKLKITDFK